MGKYNKVNKTKSIGSKSKAGGPSKKNNKKICRVLILPSSIQGQVKTSTTIRAQKLIIFFIFQSVRESIPKLFFFLNKDMFDIESKEKQQSNISRKPAFMAKKSNVKIETHTIKL